MNREEKIRDLTQKGNKLLGEARQLQEEEQQKEYIPVLQKAVGTCYKFRNSYGSDRPKWWIYAKIIGFNAAEFTFEIVQFEKTSADRIEIEFNKQYNYNCRNWFERAEWIPISDLEYSKAKSEMLQFVTNLLTK